MEAVTWNDGCIRAVLALAAAAAVLAGCGGGSHRYPAEAESNFLSSCQSSATQSGASSSRGRTFCQCVLTGLEKKVSYTEFKRVDTQVTLGDTSNLPSNVLDAVANCR